MTKWQKALTKKQRAHLREMNIHNLKQLRENFEHQEKYRDRTGLLACHECHSIKFRLKDAGLKL